MARSSMAALITRVRVLINDPSGSSQTFDDDTIQSVMDEGREDVVNRALIGKPTFTGGSIQYLNYYGDTGWEDDYVLKQYLTVTVTPSSVEPIAGHFVFSTTTLPPVYITGKVHDVYRVAADLLERWAAKVALDFDFTSDSQSFRRSQRGTALLSSAKTYRAKQRPRMSSVVRSDLSGGRVNDLSLAPTALDYMASGQ